MAALNLAWQGPKNMPKIEELGNPERWYRRVVNKSSSPAP
jgi:uncharacterized protein (DUF2342 family)